MVRRARDGRRHPRGTKARRGRDGDGGAREEGAVLAVARGRPRLETIIACIRHTRGGTSRPPANEILLMSLF